MPATSASAIVSAAVLVTLGAAAWSRAAEPAAFVKVGPSTEPMATGKFEPTWESLNQYETPEWFRDAKFGIWAHWGPQCQPANGDWYARGMYEEGSGSYKYHLKTYGHPSKFGFKDVINDWKAERWDPEKLVALYRRAGARYFFAMANHHDNLDLWDSKHQPWNSAAVGPKRDIVDGWAKAARSNGLKFGVSVHAAHAWTWYEPAQGADTKGDLAGVPYDGKLTRADGKGLWWDGLDPQDLYAQNHPRSAAGSNHHQWDWANGAAVPDQAYVDKFYNRTVDLINRFDPDLVYFDDTALPLWPVSDAGLKIAAHLYNRSMARNDGVQRAALFGKVLNEQQRDALTWDIERGAPNRIEPLPWQTDTCIGSWHYHRNPRYKSAATVVHMLADIVSKNGNLLLNVPVRGDGSIDDAELKVVEGITAWMDVNGEAIYGTRPFGVFGEGPASDGPPISAQGFNEGKGKPFSAADVRFTTKGGAIYAIVLGVPTQPLALRSLGRTASSGKPIGQVKMLGSEQRVEWSQTDDALTIAPPGKAPSSMSVVYKVDLQQ